MFLLLEHHRCASTTKLIKCVIPNRGGNHALTIVFTTKQYVCCCDLSAKASVMLSQSRVLLPSVFMAKSATLLVLVSPRMLLLVNVWPLIKSVPLFQKMPTRKTKCCIPAMNTDPSKFWLWPRTWTFREQKIKRSILVYFTFLNVQARYQQQAAMLRSKVHCALCSLAKEDQLFGPRGFCFVFVFLDLTHIFEIIS